MFRNYFILREEAGGDEGTGGAGGEGTPNFREGLGEGESFIQTLPEEFRAEPSLQSIKDLNGLVKSYVHGQKAMGGKFSVPDADADDEKWNEAFNKFGRPEDPNAYEVESAEGFDRSDEEMAELKKMFHEAGLNGRQAKVLLNKYDESLMGKLEGSKAEMAKINDDFLNKAHETFGGPEKWAKTSADVQNFLNNNVPKEIRAEMKDLDNKGLLSIVYAVDQALKANKEDQPLGGTGGGEAAQTPTSIRQELHAAVLEYKKHEPRSVEAQSLKKKMSELSTKLEKLDPKHA